MGTIQKLTNRPLLFKILSRGKAKDSQFGKCLFVVFFRGRFLEAEALLLQCAPVVADLNSVKASVGMTMLAACQMAGRDGVRVVLSGLGRVAAKLIPRFFVTSNKQGCK